LEGCAWQEALREGDQWAAQGEWAEALAAYERAQRLEPGEAEVIARLARARQEIAREQLAASERSLQAGDFEGAFVKLGEAMHHWPQNEGLMPLREAITTQVLALSRDQLGARQYEAAQETLGILQRHRGDLPELEIRRQEVSQVWAKEVRGQARRDEAEGLVTGAFARYALAASLSGDAEDAQARDRLREVILGPARWRVSLSVEGDQGRGARVRALALGALTQGRQIVVEGPKGPASASVVVSLREPVCAQSSQSEVATHRYRSGTRQVENPEWGRQWALIQRCEEELLRAEEGLDRRVDALLRAEADLLKAEEDKAPSLDRPRRAVLDARREVQEERRAVQRQRQELHGARAVLSRIPAFVEEETWSDFHYEVKLWTRSCEAAWSARALGPGGEARAQASRSTRASTQDRAHAAFVRFGIGEDPLSFPASDAGLIERADVEIGREVAEVALLAFVEDRRARKLEAARRMGSDPEGAARIWAELWLQAPGESPDEGRLLAERYGLPNPWVLGAGAAP
jgi:hypothetical protein